MVQVGRRRQLHGTLWLTVRQPISSMSAQGNGGPWNQNIRSPQGGDNLFLASIIAVNPDTGRMAWYFQENPGETWDFTATQPFVLADLAIDGQERKVIMQAPRTDTSMCSTASQANSSQESHSSTV
jgi:hypothetical protein